MTQEADIHSLMVWIVSAKSSLDFLCAVGVTFIGIMYLSLILLVEFQCYYNTYDVGKTIIPSPSWSP